MRLLTELLIKIILLGTFASKPVQVKIITAEKYKSFVVLGYPSYPS